MFKHIVNSEIEIKIREIQHSEDIFNLIDKERPHLRAWMAWVDDTKEIADVDRSTTSMLKQYVNNEGFSAGIWYKGEFAGVVSLMDMSLKHKSASIGYWLGTEFIGKGIMTKVCKDIIDYAFDELDLHRIEIRCAEGNTKSRAIPERLGFTEEGRVRESEYLYDHYVTHVVYGLLKSEIA